MKPVYAPSWYWATNWDELQSEYIYMLSCLKMMAFFLDRQKYQCCVHERKIKYVVQRTYG